MANKKKANPSPIKEKVYDIETTYKSKDGVETPIKINSVIGYEYLSALIEAIAKTIVDEDGYYPYYYNPALYGYMLQFYTDFDQSTGLMNTDKLLYETNIKDVLHENITDYQLNIIFDSVDKMIEFRKQQLSTKSEIDVSFSGLLNDLRTLVSKFDSMLDADTISKVMGNLSKMDVSNITEKSLIDALVNTTKGKGSRKTGSKNKSKDNVTVLPPVGQRMFDGSEVTE